MVLREVQRTTARQHYTRGEVWHGFLLSSDEKRRIDTLMGNALLDDCLCDLLVNKRDSSIMTRFGLSFETQSWLRSIEASSLEELAQEIALVA